MSEYTDKIESILSVIPKERFRNGSVQDVSQRKKAISAGVTAAMLLLLLFLLTPGDAAYAEGEGDGTDLIEDPSIPVVVLHIDEEQGTIEQMNKDKDHNTECHGTMDIIVPHG